MQQGVRKRKVKKQKTIQEQYPTETLLMDNSSLTSKNIKQPSTDVISMQSRLVSQISSVNLMQEDAVNIDSALESNNHFKVLLGFTAMRDFIRKSGKNLTSAIDFNSELRHGKNFEFEEAIRGKDVAMLNALSKAPRPEVEYHSMGFDTYLELIRFAFSNPKLVS